MPGRPCVPQLPSRLDLQGRRADSADARCRCMAIEIRILGKRGADNAVLVTVDTGQQVSRLLMDCGENTVSELSFTESSQIKHVLFSHFHMDHVAGFDSFFRRHYDRAGQVNHIWGPCGTMEIMGHRFRSFVWNLIGSRRSTWCCHDIGPDRIATSRYELEEAFAHAHAGQSPATPGLLFQEKGYHVDALTLNHGIPSIGYLVRESGRINVDTGKLEELGLKPGPWLKTLAHDETCLIGGIIHEAEPLRQALLVRSPGDSMAFLTDFIAEGDELSRIAGRLRGVGTLVCECQYSAADAELARRNSHMTTTWVGELAALVSPRRLMLTHFSERYSPQEWNQMVGEVRERFANVEAV
jgi:ribonuclease Z